jgi:ABC-2 type transport system permease protein
MGKYGKILGLFWQSAIAAELEYRFNFLIATITSIVNLSGSIFSLFLFYRTGYTFGGWTWEESLIVLAMFTILQGFSAIFLIPNLNKIVTHVQEGTLDFILLKPINSQFWLSTRMISPWGFPDVLFGFLILIHAGNKLDLHLNQYLITIIPLSLGMITLYSIWFMLGATSIWFVKIYNVTEVLRGLLEAGRFPMVAYPAAYRFFFTFVIPVAFLTTIPASTLLGRGELVWIVAAAILALSLFFCAKFFWRFALRFYTSASS